jgi:hypothetical protein
MLTVVGVHVLARFTAGETIATTLACAAAVVGIGTGVFVLLWRFFQRTDITTGPTSPMPDIRVAVGGIWLAMCAIGAGLWLAAANIGTVLPAVVLIVVGLVPGVWFWGRNRGLRAPP